MADGTYKESWCGALLSVLRHARIGALDHKTTATLARPRSSVTFLSSFLAFHIYSFAKYLIICWGGVSGNYHNLCVFFWWRLQRIHGRSRGGVMRTRSLPVPSLLRTLIAMAACFPVSHRTDGAKARLAKRAESMKLVKI